MVQVYPATLYDRSFDTRILVQARLEASTLYIQRENDTLSWTAGDLDDARQLDDGSVILQNNNLFLEVLEPGFAQAVKSAFENDKLFHRPFFDRIGIKGLLIALLILLIPLLLVYFWFIPVAAERASQHVSPDIEAQIGEAWYDAMIQQYTLDSDRARQVQAFYDSLHYGVGYNIRITVVKEPTINAFAIPGGRIVIFSGMLDLINTPEQLAALLAHEASHIQFRHSVHAIFHTLSNQLFFSILMGEYGDYSSIVAQYANRLAGLSYSRDLEWEADKQGIKLMQYNGIPLKGMADLFQKMQEKEPVDSEVPTFFSTHPALEARLAEARKKVAADTTGIETVPPAVANLWGQLHP